MDNQTSVMSIAIPTRPRCCQDQLVAAGQAPVACRLMINDACCNSAAGAPEFSATCPNYQLLARLRAPSPSSPVISGSSAPTDNVSSSRP